MAKKGFKPDADTEVQGEEALLTLNGMYREYFLDYASYVILERAIPAIDDGLKPVQRRILQSLKDKEDGRFHKVANVIGHAMQYHPHGDAAIGQALVKLGQKDLLIDPQGNWGDVRTGDSAAAARYIEARLTKFAKDVVFNPQTTEWQLSYDGRNKEPITLPVKFPLVLAQGVEGIAVGLSTKILPHNFIELIKASIKILQGKRVKIYPDFQTGGMADVSEYNQGKRGGKVKVRAKIEQVDKNTLAIKELPFGVTTSNLIDSIIKANDKGQIKIKKMVDNTAKDVEILIDLAPGVSPQVTIDALYAFTNCEISISPNACVIIEDKPHFMAVNDILEHCTFRTKTLLGMELEIKKKELEEKWHLTSLEKIFIENRIYRDIEECESFEEVLKVIEVGLKKYVVTPSDKAKKNDSRIQLQRDITEDDLIRLTEIKIKRISKYNKFKTDELIARIEEELKQVKYDLNHLTEYTIAFYERLLSKYSEGRERKTVLKDFETIKVQAVVQNNAKLYANYKEGFVGTGMKKEEFIQDCSNISDVIGFTKAGTMRVVRISDKVFIGKNMIHAAVWKKGDDRTTYNMIYVDGKTGRAMAKRFNVKGITRDKEYPLTKGHKGSKVIYFTANPNGESEKVQIQLTPGCGAHKKIFEFDFDFLDIKGRGAGGNIVTKYPIKKITQLEVGSSSLGAIKAWIDMDNGRLNKDERGVYLGEFDTGNKLIAIYKNGEYEVNDLDFNKKYDPALIVEVARLTEDSVISALYFEGEKGWTMVKRFQIETSTQNEKFNFISDVKGSKLYYASSLPKPKVMYSYKTGGKKYEKEMDFENFIDVKGWKALGNKIGEFKILKVTPLIEDVVVTNDTEGKEKQQISFEVEDKKEISKPSAKKDTESIPSKKAKDKNQVAKKTTSKAKAPAKKLTSKTKPAAKKQAVKKLEAKKQTAKKPVSKKKAKKKPPSKGGLNPGDTIEFDF